MIIFFFVCCKAPSTMNGTTQPGLLGDRREQSRSKYIASKDGLVLREKPTTKSKALQTIGYREFLLTPERTEICEIIDGKNGCWYKVSLNEKIGFAFGAYLADVRPKFIQDYDKDVLNARIKEIPDVGQISGWKKVSVIPGIEFQVPANLEFKLISVKKKVTLFDAHDRLVSSESFTYEDTAQAKYCASRPTECATEGGPTRVHFTKYTDVSLADYMRLRIEHDPFQSSYKILARVQKPWQGYYLKFNDLFTDWYVFIISSGKHTLLFSVVPPMGPMPQQSKLTIAEAEKIFFSLKILP